MQLLVYCFAVNFKAMTWFAVLVLFIFVLFYISCDKLN